MKFGTALTISVLHWLFVNFLDHLPNITRLLCTSIIPDAISGPLLQLGDSHLGMVPGCHRQFEVLHEFSRTQVRPSQCRSQLGVFDFKVLILLP